MYNKCITTAIPSGTAITPAINVGDILPNMGLAILPGTWTAASLGFKVSDVENGTYVPLRSATGDIVEITGIQTGAAAAYPLPSEIKGAQWIKFWSETAGSDANQAGARTIILIGKG